MKRATVLLQALAALAGVAWSGVAGASPPALTGDVEADLDVHDQAVILIADNGASDRSGIVLPDIPLHPLLAAKHAYSGVDVKDVRLRYDSATDTLAVGINTFGIAGDVDGDGDPGGSSVELLALGWADYPDFLGGESWSIRLDTDGDGAMDVVAGVPGLLGLDGYGVYESFGAAGAFGGPPLPAHAGELVYFGTESAPDIEVTIPGFCKLLSTPAWAVRVQVSGESDGVTEEAVPNTSAYTVGEADLAGIPALGDSDGDGLPDCNDPCVDVDGDGYGAGASCLGADCAPFDAGCATDCESDLDADGIVDCADKCIDGDADTYGAGPECAGPDCDDTVPACTTDCATDLDEDGAADCADPCVDPDGDGYGPGGGCSLGECDCAPHDPACGAPAPGYEACPAGVPCLDADWDGVADCEVAPSYPWELPDRDGDGLLNEAETGVYGTDPLDPDTDADGLLDGAEVHLHGTAPLDPDTDDGGVDDGLEVMAGTNPRDDPGDDMRLEYSGGAGCQAGGGGARWLGAAILALLGLWLAVGRQGWLARCRAKDRGPSRRLLPTLLGCLLIAATPARAQRTGITLDTFSVQPGVDRVFLVEGSEVAPALGVYGGMWLLYADDPLELARIAPNGSRSNTVVDDRFGGQASVGLGLFDVVELDVTIPVLFTASGGGGSVAELDRAGLGDIVIRGRGRFIGRGTHGRGFGLGAGLRLGLPTGDEERFQGDGSAWFQPAVTATYGLGPVVMAANLGLNIRTDNEAFANLIQGPEILYGFGANYRVLSFLAVSAELFGRMPLAAPFHSASDAPLEYVTGGKLKVLGDLWVETGIGFGLVPGYGSPDFRFLVGAQFAPERDREPDWDQDGIRNADDECPRVPEDLDGFEDADGCPDDDNDGDGIPDTRDGPEDVAGFGKCRDEAEDLDGFQDHDGCLDPDNDGDGLADAVDGPKDPQSGLGACRDVAEDFDGHEDSDGCPEEDNDGDGVADAFDGERDVTGFGRCRDQPEDADGFHDVDGCPDSDNDGDGIPDVADGPVDASGFGQCRDQPETRNGLEDDDGCPDTKVAVFTAPVPIYFDTNKADVRPELHPVLTEIARYLASRTDLRAIEVQGHTDFVGADAFNQELSQRRVDAVVQLLVDNGVPEGKLLPVGYGEQCPVIRGQRDGGIPENRRVELFVVDPAPDGRTAREKWPRAMPGCVPKPTSGRSAEVR